MSAAELLFELGTEELPPGSLRALGEALREGICARLDEQRIPHGAARFFASPRRLAVSVEGVSAQQDDAVIEKLGPQVSAAFDASGKPTGAALGFARGCGVDIAELGRSQAEKGERLAFRQTVPGQPVASLLPALVESVLGALPIAKRMRWGTRRDEFVRPVQWVVLLHGSTVVPGTVLGLATGRTTRGHRVHGEASIVLDDAGSYEQALRTRGFVIADHEARRAEVARQVEAAAHTVGGHADLDPRCSKKCAAWSSGPARWRGVSRSASSRCPPRRWCLR